MTILYLSHNNNSGLVVVKLQVFFFNNIINITIMNVEEFDELVKTRNRIREKIYIKLVSNNNNNIEYEQLFTIAHEAAVAYISNAIYLTDKDVDDIRKYVGVNY